MKKKNVSFERVNVLLLLLDLLILVFIFSHSIATADLSSNESGFVRNLLNFLLNTELSEHIVRKIAHFTEFFAFGFCTSMTVFSFNKNILTGTFLKLFACLSSAVLDEFLQLSSDGRSGQVTDIILDFGGSLAGIVMSIIAVIIYMKGFEKNGKEKQDGI